MDEKGNTMTQGGKMIETENGNKKDLRTMSINNVERKRKGKCQGRPIAYLIA